MRNFKALLFLLVTIIPLTVAAQLTFEEDEIIGKADAIFEPKLFHNETLDLDLDEDFDILVHSRFNILWYENKDGAGDFSTAREIFRDDALTIIDMQIGDLDGDGDLDIVCLLDTVGLGPNKMGWITNLGNGSFSGFNLIEEFFINLNHLDIRDIDGDNDSDILFNVSGDGVVWYENLDGLGTFANQELILPTFGNSIPYLMIEDVNGDSLIDLVQYDFVNDQLAWYENLGNVTFSSAQPFHINLNAAPYFIIKADIDGDTNPDFIASYNNGSPNLTWYEFDGVGELSRTVISAPGSLVVTTIATDMDNDGDQDLLYTNGNTDGALIWLENEDSLGTFSAPNIIDTEICYSGCMDPNKLATGDFDGNGTMDVITSPFFSSPGAIYRYSNLDGLGNFGTKKIVSEIPFSDAMESMDIDNDGDLDLLNLAYGRIFVYRNLDGNANFGKQELVSEIGSTNFATTIDVDNDGDLDLVSNRFNAQQDFVWYENINGLGLFGEAIVINASLGTPIKIATGDIDGDGFEDLAPIFSTDNETLYWLRNLNGSGTFSEPIVAAVNVNIPKSIELEDIDGDGDLDIVLDTNAGLVEWYENTDGAGNFGSAVVLSGGNAWRGFHVADLDLDNDLDIITYGTEIRWFENTDGLGTFGNSVLIGNPSNYIQYLEVTDLDGDLDQDVVWKSYGSGGLFWYENLTGNEDFSSQTPIYTSDITFVQPAAALGDFNGDFKMDIAYAHGVAFGGYEPARLIVLKNQGEQGNQIIGAVTNDLDSSGCDNNDPIAPNLMVTASNGVDTYSTFTLPNGVYNINVGQGTYTTNISGTLPTYYAANPSEYEFMFSGIGATEFGNFCIEAQQVVNDLEVQLFPLTEVRPGFETQYIIIFKNVGTTVLEGEVTLNFNEDALNFIEASAVPSGMLSGALTFDFGTLLPFESDYINVSFLVEPPPIVNIDDLLITSAQGTIIGADDFLENNEFILEQVAIGSFDPNDIQVLEGSEILEEDLDNYLHYIIRFQNTGTASAINVQVINQIDPNLNWESFQILETSHSADIKITNGQYVTFTFNDINLPDSNSNEEESNGFIAYKIKPTSNLQIGDSMSNTAEIYFDFNQPITTNTVTTTVIETLSVQNFETSDCNLYPVPFTNSLNISCANNNITQVELFNIQGKLLLSKLLDGKTDTIDVSGLVQGVYIIKLKDTSGAIFIKKGIKDE